MLGGDQNDQLESRQIYIMRHAERVDFTFTNWISTCFSNSGTYIRRDLNMPISIPRRNGSPLSFIEDTPITNLGFLASKLTGEALLNNGINIKYCYSSPALRSVQTCDAVAQGLGIKDTTSIKIEPSLFEWLAWYQPKLPQWLTTEEYLEAGFNIDKSYTPFLNRSDMKNLNESCEQYYERCHKFMQHLLNNTKGDEGNILIVAHGPSLDACSRQLRGLPPRNVHQLNEILHEIHYCNNIRLYKDKTNWKIAESSVPCFTNLVNKTFDWRVLSEN